MFPDGRLETMDFHALPPLPNGGRRALQSSGPGSEGEVVGVVRRALKARVVVHAPTMVRRQHSQLATYGMIDTGLNQTHF